MTSTTSGTSPSSMPTGRRERPGKAAIMRAAVTVMGEDGYEGASMRDMASRAGVTVAALYYHFPSKLDLLREFLDESWDVIIARIDRRLAAAADQTPTGQLNELVATLIASFLHDEYAQVASNVALREYTRLEPPDRALIDDKRLQVLQRADDIVLTGVHDGEMNCADPREAARAIIILCGSLVEPYPAMNMTMAEVIDLYQGFARRIAGAP